MKKILFFMALALSLSLTVLTLPDSAEAKRLGGGRSFGSKPAYSQKYQKSSLQQPNQQGAPQTTPAGGRGPFGGLLGGLLAGGLIGSLLFGGAFNGISLLNILLISAARTPTMDRGAMTNGGGVDSLPLADYESIVHVIQYIDDNFSHTIKLAKLSIL